MLKYIELKTGFGSSGPAWISRVTLSRSKTTVYFNGRALKKVRGGGISGNYIDVETGEEYWISGVKKSGTDRHWAGSGPVYIDKDVVEEYLLIRGLEKLDPKHYLLTDSIVPTDIEKFTQLENHSDWKYSP